ncbi:MAG: peptide chain release factor N(5)-glutamine methyltransferase [Pedobacter sp.]|nr:MAG: peptide chain release factor N(5)-glutamine methyltransferase [Pedobacter sp.]
MLGFNKATYILKKQDAISETDILKFKNILNDLSKGNPIQYVFGEAEFYGLKFKVNPSVLIPRPETEELVEWILECCKSSGYNGLDGNEIDVLDIGTGSGCIPIALKKHMPNANVSALDISIEALATAKENAELNNLTVDFIEGDILNHSIVQSFNHSKLDVIVSNPPYIKEDEKPAMHKNVLANEPHIALFVSNENPLVFYTAIADFAKANLKINGLLFFEINEYLGKETMEMLASKGFVNIELRKDMQGKDRMILAKKTN